MRAASVLAIAAGAMAIISAPAQADRRPSYEREYLDHYKQLREREGVRSPGCNLITAHYGNKCAGKASKAGVIKSNATLERMLYVPPSAPVASPVGGANVAPSASVGAGGNYCGLFQFDQQTWESVGGSGSPCAASSAEQWDRAQQLQSQRGNQPWPVCGQGGASLEQIARCESGGDPNAVG